MAMQAVRTWMLGGSLAASASAALVACSGSGGAGNPASTRDAGDATSSAPPLDGALETGASEAGAAGDDGPFDGGDAAGPTCITLASPQACAPPKDTALPICNLRMTGCMDATNPTSFAANAIPYQVISPLWSDGAAKSRAFVLPSGGKIHVKNCMPDAGATALAGCVAPNGVSNGAPATGEWEFPVGAVMIKNFLFDGKLVETRLLMHVDASTAALIGNGTDWVGYNYAWNEAQTEALVVPDTRTAVTFNTGQHTVTWHYPSFADCIECHSAAVGTLGPENDQMNLVVNGANQIDTFEEMGLFDDTAPTKPYAAPMVEPYANAALGLAGPPADAGLDPEARSYLAANCGFCHRPDVNDLGFDLRYSLTLYQTGICGLPQGSVIPGTAGANDLDLAPGNHADSAMWLRMSIAVPACDPDEQENWGRMPPLASYVVDTQAASLIATWIDSLHSCPTQ